MFNRILKRIIATSVIIVLSQELRAWAKKK